MLPSDEVPSLSPVPTIRPLLSCTSMEGLSPVVLPALPSPLLWLPLPLLSVVSVHEACNCQDKLGSACCKIYRG